MLPDPSPRRATTTPLDPNDQYIQKLIRYKAKKLVGKTGLKRLDVDDIAQDIWLDLIQRLPGFDPSRSQQRTFVTRLVDHKISNILRDQRAQKRDICRCHSLNVPLGVGHEVDGTALLASDTHDRRTGCVHRSGEEQAYLAEDVSSIVATMPENLQELTGRLKQGESQSAIARELGIPRTTLQELVYRIRRRFEDVGLRDYL